MSRAASRPARPLVIPLFLVALVAWQWLAAGGAPRRGGSIVPGLLVAALVLWSALVTVVRPRALARLSLPVVVLLLGALVVTDIWLIAHGRVAPLTLVPWALFLAFCTWLWWTVRSARRLIRPPPDADPPTA